MKNSIKRGTFLLTIALFLIAGNASAQFEQKLTLQIAGSYVQAISPEAFTDIFIDGFAADAGIQYNFSRSASLLVLAKYAKFFYFAEPDFHLDVANFNQLGISLCPKYRFLPHLGVNPFIFGGASLNYISISYDLRGFDAGITKSPVSLGFIGGAGADIRLNDNFALFLQGGMNRVDQGSVWIDSWFVQAGLNINMFKARTL